jgi:hypothetical protein
VEEVAVVRHQAAVHLPPVGQVAAGHLQPVVQAAAVHLQERAAAWWAAELAEAVAEAVAEVAVRTKVTRSKINRTQKVHLVKQG